jgi:hypothetical protein
MKPKSKEHFDSLDKFNSLMNQASQAMSCGSECQRKNTIDSLKQKVLSAKSNLATAPEQVQSSTKNYLLFAKGQPAYNEYLDKTLEEKATQIATKFKKNFNGEVNKALSNIKIYIGLLINLKNVVDLYAKYKLENIELIKKLKDNTSDVLTNERKTYYQDQGIDTLKILYKYFLITIYVIFIIGFGVSGFVFPSKYDWKVRLGILVGLILLPFICTKILASVINIIYKIYGLLPKNVHLSM